MADDDRRVVDVVSEIVEEMTTPPDPLLSTNWLLTKLQGAPLMEGGVVMTDADERRAWTADMESLICDGGLSYAQAKQSLSLHHNLLDVGSIAKPTWLPVTLSPAMYAELTAAGGCQNPISTFGGAPAPELPMPSPQAYLTRFLSGRTPVQLALIGGAGALAVGFVVSTKFRARIMSAIGFGKKSKKRRGRKRR